MSKRNGQRPSIMVNLSMLVILGIVVAIVFMFGVSKVMAKHEVYNQGLEVQQEKEIELKAILERTKELQQKQVDFRNDRDFLAEVAHEKGMASPGEFLVKFKGEE